VISTAKNAKVASEMKRDSTTDFADLTDYFDKITRPARGFIRRSFGEAVEGEREKAKGESEECSARNS